MANQITMPGSIPVGPQTTPLSPGGNQPQLAQSNPGIHNLYEAYRRMYEAVGVQNIEAILPPPQPPQPTDPAIENARAIAGQNIQAFQEQDHDAHMASHISFMKTPVVASSPQIFALLLAHLCEHIAFKARGVAMMEAMTMAQQAQQAGQPEPMVDGEAKVAQYISQYTEEVLALFAPPQQGPDPLVALREKELNIQAMDMQRKAMEFDARMQFEENREDGRQDIAKDRIQSSEDIAQLRAQVNRERFENKGGILLKSRRERHVHVLDKSGTGRFFYYIDMFLFLVSLLIH